MTKNRLLSPLLAAGLLAALPGVASARDRDHDHMPDRWEAAHGLNIHVNDARRDHDHDGLRNLAEFRAQTDPSRKDSDGDGIGDRAEHAGTVTSFTAGVLTLTLFDGTTLAAKVDDSTELECKSPAPAPAAPATASAARHGDGGGDDGEQTAPPAPGTPAPAAGDDGDHQGSPSGGDQGDDQGDDSGDDDGAGDNGGSCTTAALTPGARVDEAVLAVTSAGRVFRKVELDG